MTAVIINPGTGPLAGCLERNARRNMGAFCRELAFRAPIVRIERDPSGDFDGRYGYKLARGIRHSFVSMPGLPTDRVVLGPHDNAWDFPRLYVDGNSWLWPFAIEMAKHALLDHDGTSEFGYLASERDADFVFKNEPRCPACGTIRDRYLTETDNHPYGYIRVRCLGCVPVERTSIKNWDLSATYRDDSWKRLPAGTVYSVTERMMPYEALGTEEDPLCRRRDWTGRICRLPSKHAGPCKGSWEIVKKERIELPYKVEQP